MARRKLTSYFLYRRRVLLAYVFIFASLGLLLILALFIPGGITASEQASSVRAMSSPLIQVNAPFYVLQKLSVSLFGLSAFSIKLPSIVLGLLLGASLFLLLRRWLTLGIAVFASLIIFSETTFLALTGTGSPTILYVLYPALLLFFGTRVIAHDSGLIVFALLSLITLSMSLLTPTMVYLVVLVVALGLFNPHVRYGIHRLPVTGRIILGLGVVIAILPLASLLFTQPSAARDIFAIPSSVTLDSIGSNISTLFALFLSFLNPGLTGNFPSPLVGLSTAGLAILGLYRMIRAIYTARAQFILSWGVIALVLAVIDPGYGILLYLPVVLLAALGLSHLAAIWYRTFPLNPYARLSALVPISILIIGIVTGSSMRYINTTLYADGSAELYSRDLQTLEAYLKTSKQSNVTLAVADRDLPFYKNLTTPAITNVVPLRTAATTQGVVIASDQIEKGIPVRILSDGRSHDADRFYIYQ